MKSAILPQVRIEPELRAELKPLLRDGESLAGFTEDSVRSAVAYRRAEAEFYARGEAAWQAYSRTGVAHPAGEVIGEMRQRLESRRKQLGVAQAKAR